VYDAYQYEEVTEWTAEQFEALDVFVIPSGGEAGVVEFSLSEAALDALVTFTEEGGRVILLGRAQMAPEMNRIMRRFGMAFDERAIKSDNGDPYAFYADTPVSSLTPFLPAWRARLGVPLSETGEAEVLSWIDDGQETWLQGEEESEKTSATGLPVMAALHVGSGAVLAIGESNQFLNPEPIRDIHGQGLIENVIPSLVQPDQLDRLEELADESATVGGETNDSDGEGETGADEDSDGGSSAGEENEEDADTQDESIPGFGVVQTITSVIGGVVAARRIRNRSNDE